MTVDPNGEDGLRTALILYGSETGNAQDVAEELGRLVERLHFLTRVSDMNSVDLVWITLVSCSLSLLCLLTISDALHSLLFLNIHLPFSPFPQLDKEICRPMLVGSGRAFSGDGYPLITYKRSTLLHLGWVIAHIQSTITASLGSPKFNASTNFIQVQLGS